MDKKWSGSPDLRPDAVAGWFKKYKGIKKQIDEQLLRGLQKPGEGLTLDHLQLLVEHRNSFADAFEDSDRFGGGTRGGGGLVDMVAAVGLVAAAILLAVPW